MQLPNDEDLVLRVAQGDHAAFGLLVDRHMKRAASLAQNILRSAADADEVAQEAFLRLWERPHRFDPAKARFSTWLYRVVVNACLDRRRARRFEPIDAAADRPAGGAPPSELLDAHREQEAVRRALATLPARQRSALALFHLEELSQREAAAAMQLSESAFESLLHRARSALASALASTRREEMA